MTQQRKTFQNTKIRDIDTLGQDVEIQNEFEFFKLKRMSAFFQMEVRYYMNMFPFLGD